MGAKAGAMRAESLRGIRWKKELKKLYIDCVYLPMVSQTVGSEREDGLECRDGIIICSHWMSCQTDFYNV